MHPQQLLVAASDLVAQALRFDGAVDAQISHFFKSNRARLNLGQRERGILAQTVYNVLRYRLRYEWFARSGTGAQARRLALLGYPRGNASDQNFLDAALNTTEQAWLQMCDAQAPDDGLDPHRHNLPPWLAQALQVQLGAVHFWAWAEAQLQAAPIDVRINTLLGKPEVPMKALDQAHVTYTRTPYSPMGLRLQGHPALQKLAVFNEGWLEVQDEGSQLVALLTGAKRGEMVADFCAGAGGKTLALGAAMKNTGRLYAFDVSAHRLAALKPRLARSRLSNIYPVAIAHENDERLKRLAGKMDRVLVDAPCSGLGTLRRNPDLKWRQKESDIAELASKQSRILAGAAKLLKPGGRLVYATCSVLPQESEHIAQAFSQAHPDFLPLKVDGLLSDLQIPHAQSLCEADPQSDATYLRLWTHRHHTDGFFAAAWQRARA